MREVEVTVEGEGSWGEDSPSREGGWGEDIPLVGVVGVSKVCSLLSGGGHPSPPPGPPLGAPPAPRLTMGRSWLGTRGRRGCGRARSPLCHPGAGYHVTECTELYCHTQLFDLKKHIFYFLGVWKAKKDLYWGSVKVPEERGSIGDVLEVLDI